jgi:hypothetical protein
MARGTTDQRDDIGARPDNDDPEVMVAEECHDLQRLTSVVRIAMGRLGAQISPWLDEGLLMGQGLVTLLELTGDPTDRVMRDHEAVGWVVSGMRTWARASSWYRAAWPCRIAPLCSSLAERQDAPDLQTARDLGLSEEQLSERYTEAGLLFGVSPELLLPASSLTARPGALTGAISQLPLQQRQLLTVYFEDGLSFQEIGELLDISPERAQRLYGRAATAIRAGVFGTRQLAGACG